MKYTELKKSIEENGVMPIYLLEGEEGYFRAGGCEALLGKINPEKTIDYASFDGASLKGDKLKGLVASLLAFPFVGEKRVVKVTEFYPTEKDYESYLKDVFENPPETTVFIIVNSGKGKKETANLAQKGKTTYVDCSKADEEMIKKWIFVTAKRQGVYVDAITCGKIAGYCALDMSRVSKEVEKLLIVVQETGEKRISDSLVEEIVHPDTEYKIYELSGALSNKNYTQFIRIAEELKGKGYDELSLLSSLCFHYRDVYDVAKSKGTDKEVATALNMREYAVKKDRMIATKIGVQRAKEIYQKIFDAITGIKSGKYTPASSWKLVVGELFFS